MNKKKICFWIIAVLLINIFSIVFNTTVSKANSDTGRTIEDGIYVIRSKIDSKFVLDVLGASIYNGTNVQLYEYTNVAQKKYKVTYLGDGYYSIIAMHSNKSIDVKDASKKKGANVQQWESNNTDAQKWMIKDVGNGYYSIISKCNGLYVDVHNAVAANGTNIQMCDGNGLDAQKFKFEKVGNSTTNNTQTGTKTIENGVYYINSAINEKYSLDVANGSKANEANIQLYQNNGKEQQQFKVTYLDNGYYTIIAMHSNKAMDVKDASKNKGANVQQCEQNGLDAQKWMIKDVGNGYYSIISKCNGLYVDVHNAVAANGTNIQMCDGNGLNAQKFKFVKVESKGEEGKNEEIKPITGAKTIEDGIYTIHSTINSNFVLDVAGGSTANEANIQLYKLEYNAKRQQFKVTYNEEGYYTIIAMHSNKSMDVKDASKNKGANVQQCEQNGLDAQKWIIKDVGNGSYSIISRCNGLYVDVYNAVAANGTNIQMCDGNGLNAQKFIFKEVESNKINIDENKYPGYKEAIEKLKTAHPTWNFELLYTGIKFSDAVAGEAKVHSRNLVETNYAGEWICSVCGTKLYDSGWYCASEKAIAYYMDPRNFLDEVNIFQFQDVNSYLEEACTLEGIKQKVSGSFLQNYAEDVNTACKNTNVNPYYIIARLFQEQGVNGTTIGKGMDGGDGKTYYNPFNIGATGNGNTEIYNNALARAKKEGWDTMEKAIEGGIYFCKVNWLENYQNTLYQNRFDIDTRNGSNLYEHQYMQNLLGAYSEARTLQSMYKNTSKLESGFTFIIPVYEGMEKEISPLPSNTSELYPINVGTTGTNINLRQEPNTDSAILKTIAEKGTVLLSIERGINANWQKIITIDGTIGYISGTYLKQIDDITTCNYTAKVKTNDGNGCNIRVGPGTSAPKITALADGVEVTVIDNSTYKNINGFDWYRIVLADGRQAFMPGNYLK